LQARGLRSEGGSCASDGGCEGSNRNEANQAILRTRPSRRRRSWERHSGRGICATHGCRVRTFVLGNSNRPNVETKRYDRTRTHWERWHLAGHWRKEARMRAAQLGLDHRAKDFSPLQRGKSTSAKLHSMARRTGPACNATTTERSPNGCFSPHLRQQRISPANEDDRERQPWNEASP
jgi:hypothetical protein